MLKKVVLFLLIVSYVQAIDYYVAKDGSGDYSTIQAAVNTAGPGDNVYVRAGNYPENVQIENSGSELGGYITIRAFEDDYVSLDPGSINGWDVSYIKIIGFHVLNPPRNDPGFDWGGDGGYIEIRDNEVAYADNDDQACIRFGGHLHHFIIDGNHIHDCSTGSQEALRVNEYTSDFEITNNVVHDNTNIGIDVVGWEQYGKPVRGLISHNLVYDNSRQADYSAGIYVDCGSYITIEYNIAYGNKRGFEIACEPNGDVTEGNIMRYNIAYNNEQRGLSMGGYQGGIARDSEIYNNVFYNNGVEIGFDSNPPVDNEFYNNIFYSSNGRLVDSAGQNTFDHNLFYDGSDVGSNNVLADPLFVNPTSDFHVQTDSPACGAGRDGEDIGVYVCGSSGAVCGDGICDSVESCTTCEADCGECCVPMTTTELSAEIDRWKQGEIDIQELMGVIATWKSGC